MDPDYSADLSRLQLQFLQQALGDFLHEYPDDSILRTLHEDQRAAKIIGLHFYLHQFYRHDSDYSAVQDG